MLKAMAPEQLLESLLIATQPSVAKDDEANRKFKEDWMRRLTVNFGDDEGNELTYNGTIVQALLMMNGRDINAALGANSGTVQGRHEEEDLWPHAGPSLPGDPEPSGDPEGAQPDRPEADPPRCQGYRRERPPPGRVLGIAELQRVHPEPLS